MKRNRIFKFIVRAGGWRKKKVFCLFVVYRQSSCNQGMYTNRVKNDRKIFEIPAFLSSERGKNPEQENSK